MTVLDRVKARAEIRRSDPVSMEEFGYLLGASRGQSTRTKSGVSVGAKRALGLTAWYSGARYLSESVAFLPWHHYQRLDQDSRERRAKQPWLERPDVEQTFPGLVEFWVMSMIHKGNGLAFKLRNQASQVVGLREIHPDRTTPGQAPDGTKRWAIDDQVYSTRDILHIPGLAYDGRVGLNPIQTFADALGAVAAADDYAGRFFGASTHMGGLITVPQALSGTQAEALREEWDQFHQGLLNAHKTGVLSKGATYTKLALNAEDAQLLESRQYGIAEVSRMLRIPPHKLYDLSRATFSNIEHQAIEAVTDSIRPWVARIENAINSDPDLVLPGHYVEASLEGMLRGDSAARAAYLAAGINGGWMMPSRAARLENEPAPPELDYYLRPLNMAVIRPGQPEEDPTAGGAQ